MATDFGMPVESGSSSLDDESESGKSLAGSFFSTWTLVPLVVLAVGAVLLPPLTPKGADFRGILVSVEGETELLDGLVVLFVCDGEDFPEGTLGGRTMMSLVLSSESSSILLVLDDSVTKEGVAYRIKQYTCTRNMYTYVQWNLPITVAYRPKINSCNRGACGYCIEV